MRTTYRQPPNMKGKKLHLFGCGCCYARNVLDEALEKIALRDMREAAEEMRVPQEQRR